MSLPRKVDLNWERELVRNWHLPELPGFGSAALGLWVTGSCLVPSGIVYEHAAVRETCRRMCRFSFSERPRYAKERLNAEEYQYSNEVERPVITHPSILVVHRENRG